MILRKCFDKFDFRDVQREGVLSVAGALPDEHLGEHRAVGPDVAAGANYPMAFDEPNHRLFVGCRQPAKLLAYDTVSGKLVTTIGVVGDTDDLFYDDAKKRLNVVGGEGFITVLEQQDADHYRESQKLPTAAGARTGLFVPELGKLFLAVPHRGPQRAEIRLYDVGS